MVLDGTVPSPDLGTEVLERLGVIRDNGGYRERTIAEAAKTYPMQGGDVRAGQPTAEPEQIDKQINDFESGWWILYCDPGRFVPHARQEPALAQSAHRVACFPGRGLFRLLPFPCQTRPKLLDRPAQLGRLRGRPHVA